MAFILQSLLAMWKITGEMAPYLVFGFMMAGVLSLFISPELVKKHWAKRGFWGAFKAALIGVPMPLCSCGVVPVGATLRRHGASKGATAAFIASTPQTGVDSVMVNYALLGPFITVVRVLVAFLTGVLCGTLVDQVDSDKNSDNIDESEEGTGKRKTVGEAVKEAARYGLVTLPGDIAVALIIGLVISGLIGVVVPDNFFADKIGRGFLSMIVMLFVGVPIYVCSTASVPIALTFIKAGVSPGAALVFLISGPATNAATISAIVQMLGKRAAIVYLAVIAVCAVAAGYFVNLFDVLPQIHLDLLTHEHASQNWFHSVSAILLIIMLLNAIYQKRKVSSIGDAVSGIVLSVPGMTCAHCAETIEKALKSLESVDQVDIGLKEKKVVVRGRDVSPKSLIDLLAKEEFKATVVENEEGFLDESKK